MVETLKCAEVPLSLFYRFSCGVISLNNPISFVFLFLFSDNLELITTKKKPGPKKIPSTSVNPDPMLPNPPAPYNHGAHYFGPQYTGPQYPFPQYPIPQFPVPHYPVYLYPVHPYPVPHPQGYQNPGSQYPPHYEGGLHMGPSSAYAGNMAHSPPEGYSDDNFSGKGESSGFNSPGK